MTKSSPEWSLPWIQHYVYLVERREYVLRIPMRVIKGDWNGRFLGKKTVKRVASYRCLDEITMALVARPYVELLQSARKSRLGYVRLGYCFTPYQRLWLYDGDPLVAFYYTLGIRRTYSRFKPPASSRGGGGGANLCAVIYITEISLHVTLNNQSHSLFGRDWVSKIAFTIKDWSL